MDGAIEASGILAKGCQKLFGFSVFYFIRRTFKSMFRKRSLLLSFCAFLCLPALLANKKGPAHKGGKLRTGAAGSVASCDGGGCHAGNSENTTITALTLTDAATGKPATAWLPGKSYNLLLKASNKNALPKFGFQISASTKSGNAGTLIATMPETGTDKAEKLTVLEHTAPLKGVNGSYEISGRWVAPTAGAGIISLQAMLNACNGNNRSSGDEPATKGITLLLPEGH